MVKLGKILINQSKIKASKKMKAIVYNRLGGPEVLEYVDRPAPVAGAGEVLVQVAVAGVNFMDVGVRQGMAWNEMPFPRGIGVEGAGRVVAVGTGVTDFQPDQRVAWVYAPGSYAEMVVVPAAALVHVPDFIDDRTAAAIMMQGLTASHFATDFYPVQPGETALIHAAAGGVGLLMTQIIKQRGGKVIGRVSSTEKVAAAKEAGADHVIVDTEGNFASEALRLTDGEGVHVVYDGSGPATFQGSLDSLRRGGTFCWYGPVLGGPKDFNIMSLPKSIKIGYGVYRDHIPTPALLRERAAQLFSWVRDGVLTVRVGGEYTLADAAQAQIAIAGRGSVGKLLLIPDHAAAIGAKA